MQMDKALYDTIGSWLDGRRGEMTEDLKRLVRIPSVSDENSSVAPFGQPCRDVLEEYLAIAREKGFAGENHEYYCASAWLPEQQGKTEDAIGVWSHLDVVPAGSNWTGEPFVPVEREGYLVARGVDDNKAAAVGAMYAALCLRALGVKLSHPLRLFGGTNEERGMADLEYYTKHYPCPKLSIVPDSGYPVCYGEKGSMTVELVSGFPANEAVLDFSGGVASNMVPDSAQANLKATAAPAESGGVTDVTVEQSGGICTLRATGISKHIAFPDGARSAIAGLAGYMTGLEQLGERDRAAMAYLHAVGADFTGEVLGIAQADELSGPLTCVGALASLDGERRYRLQLGIRYPITVDSAAIAVKLRESAAKNGFEVDIRKDSKPNLYPKGSPIVVELTKLWQEITGQDRDAFTMGGGTYARKLPNAFGYGLAGGIPDERKKNVFPPGHGGAHEPDEALNLDNWMLGVKIFTLALVTADALLD